MITNAHLGTAIIQTANIADINVTSLKIANNAVTNRAEARAGGQALSGAETDQVSVTVSTNGGSVLVIARTYFFWTSGSWVPITIRLKRDGTMLDEITGNLGGGKDYFIPLGDLDAPAAGTYTYKVTAFIGGGGANSGYLGLWVTEYLK